MTGELEVIHERRELKSVQDETWELFTNGASCTEGAGVGLVLTSPSGEGHTYALHFNFDVTNNEAEYVALLAGLNIGKKMKITKLRAYTDFQLVANQFNGSFEAHELSMQKYLKIVQEAAEAFEYFELSQFPRNQNKKADALSKIAALTFSNFQKQVWVKELPSKSIDGGLVIAAIDEMQPNWMNPIVEKLRNNVLPEDKHEARLVREIALMYVMDYDVLYRKSFTGPLMRCLGPAEAVLIVEEVHSGFSALHSGYKTIAAKIMRMGYFWPSVQVRNFVWEYIVYRFGIPRELVSDNGAQIATFKTWCEDLNIIQKFTSVAHPQANGLCEVTNHHIVSRIKKRLNEKRMGWVDELSNVLGGHRTTFKKSNGERPFSLVYGFEAVISAAILVPTYRIANFDEEANNEALCENLNFIEERKLMA
ncbi:uncharacterized protein [Rutidosis leptorrhynchoides]|uniref:uncharacterized protein n=1 Tax=Rutidosis leptorrhynchoides TaxID=125765 RepID=UPI003A99C709